MRMLLKRAWLGVILACFSAGMGLAEPPRKTPNFELFVTDPEMAVVKLFDGKTGKFLRDFAIGNNLQDAQMMAWGPDGNLYVSVHWTVQCFDGKSGQFLKTFATHRDLNVCTGLAFGSDGKLYVASAWTRRILRFDAKTGAYLDVFVPNKDAGEPDIIPDMTLGPDGNIYLLSTPQGSRRGFIKRYNGKTGAFMGDFAGGNGLDAARRMTFGPDGNLYIVNDIGETAEVKRFDGKTGAFMDNFVPKGVGQLKPICTLAFAPDGDLYVTTSNPAGVKHFDGKTGRYLGDLVMGGSGDTKTIGNLLFRAIPPKPSKGK